MGRTESYSPLCEHAIEAEGEDILLPQSPCPWGEKAGAAYLSLQGESQW